MEWYREDEDTLRDISNGDITIFRKNHGYIHPQTWEEVIEHNSQIDFRNHSAYDSDDSDDSDAPESKGYESSVQYVVNFRRSAADGKEYLVTTKTYKEPVKFEVADNNDRLPALQEIKDILSPHSADTATTGDIADSEKTKLGTHDRVVDTSLRINSQYLLNVLRSLITYMTFHPMSERPIWSLACFITPTKNSFITFQACSNIRMKMQLFVTSTRLSSTRNSMSI